MVMTVMTNLIVVHQLSDAKSLGPQVSCEYTLFLQLDWLWLRNQPQSALALWFKEWVNRNGGRLKKTTIVALARKLLVALWKYVTAGVVNGDMVIVLFDATATARDGVPYNNTYTWYFQMKDAKVVSRSLCFDTRDFDEFWTRVLPNH